ncbi:MAG: 16S rRNA (uracil(1498)-N(3))-methyltransferase [Elusimicrobia bacterium]|nr:16S rRNA (uracil(1498)-N(3))-methyltransferase [Elusimicrobiota bacterium]
MAQFFLPPEALTDKVFHLSGPEAYHLVKVLRYQAGQPLTLFNGKGGRFSGVIEKINPDGSVSGRLTATLESPASRPAARLNLYQGLLKSSHWEWVLEKGTELGVSAFYPMLTPRTVVVLREAERNKAKQERWSRIVLAASKQCRRAELPEVKEPIQFRDAIKACEGKGLTLVAWEGFTGATARQTLGETLRENSARLAEKEFAVNLFIGPEGGFSEEEIELAESLGAKLFGLGSRTLRAETATLTACALIQYELGAL